MYTLKITNIEKARHQATGTDFLDVTVQIYCNELRTISQEDLDANPDLLEAGVKVGEEVELPVVVSEQKHAFDPAISKEELQEKVKAILDGYTLEQKQKLDNAENEAINQNVYELQADLVGSEISVDDTKENQ
jgi:hypothetical protein